MELRSPSLCHHVAQQSGFGRIVLFQQCLSGGSASGTGSVAPGELQVMKAGHSMILEAAKPSQSAHESLRAM